MESMYPMQPNAAGNTTTRSIFPMRPSMSLERTGAHSESNIGARKVSQVDGYRPWLDIVAPLKSPSSLDQSFTASPVRPEAAAGAQSTDVISSPAALLHDARNMVAALELYCDLLEEPGVLSAPFKHYAADLRLVSHASRRLLDRLARTNGGVASADRGTTEEVSTWAATRVPFADGMRDGVLPLTERMARNERLQRFAAAEPIVSLGNEVQANRNLLTAVMGPAIALELSIEGGSRPVAVSRENLTRVLVNLAKNAAEAMPRGGRVELAIRETEEGVCLRFSDSGPGIPAPALERIFAPGFSMPPVPEENRRDDRSEDERWTVRHSGLGLSIVRSIVTAAGGTVRAANRTSGSGAVIELIFPVQPNSS